RRDRLPRWNTLAGVERTDMRYPVIRIRRILAGLALATLVGAGCDSQGKQGGRVVSRDTSPDPPLVGGPCTYEHLAFRATVDSMLADGALLVRPDTTPAAGGLCDQVREAGGGRWRVPGPATGPRPTPGDTIEVVGDVIVTGTCVPCSTNTRVVAGGGR
ncbi:MAG TPA: hypothetical protein VE173_05750, partial [Longimicrobiales bacterium]|nr:hypothetical protein [Longimicrobiales bacterium]